MARMSLDTAIRLSAEVKGGGNIDRVKRSLQDLAKSGQTTAREYQTLRSATFQFARANDGTIAGIRNSINAFRGLHEQAKIGSREYTRYGSEIQKLEAKLRGIDGTAEKAGKSMGQNLAAGLAAGLAAMGAGQAVRGSLEAVVASEESQRRLRSLSTGLDDYSRVQATATAAAQKFGVAQTQANQEFAQIYARLRPVGLTLEEISTVYNGFNTAAKLSGTTSAEASAAFLQLSQALGTGVLRGEELNSVFEQTPAVVQSIAQVMGVPIGQIRDLAKEGKISGDIVMEALGRIERDGAPKLAEAMKGPAQQFKNLGNEGVKLQEQLGKALLPVAIALTKAATALLQETNKLPAPVKAFGGTAALAGIAVLGLVTAAAALKAGLAALGFAGAITALKGLAVSAGTAGNASAVAAVKTKALGASLATLGKIGLITVGVSVAIYGLQELERTQSILDRLRGKTPGDIPQSGTFPGETREGLVKRQQQQRNQIAELEKKIRDQRTIAAAMPSGTGVLARRELEILERRLASARRTIAADPGSLPNAMGTPTAATVGGGGGGVGGGGGGGGGGEAKKQSESMGAQIAKALQNALDLTPAQAAGVVGNLMRESGLNPRVNEGGGVGAPRGVGGYGLAQWTGTRQKDLVRFAGGSAAAGDLQTQLRFMVSELMGLESKALASLRKATTPEDAAVVFDRDYERSGVKALPERKSNARRVYGEIAGSGPGAGLDDFAGQLKSQAEAAEKMREQLKAAESTNVALKDRLAIAQTMEPIARQMLEYDIGQNQLAREYQDLRDKAAGPDELILINANLIIEQRIKQIEHEEKLNSLLADRAVLMANIATQAAMPTVYNELETQEAALQAVLDKYPAIGAAADAAATLATSGVSEMIAGTKDAEEVFVDFLGSIADALMDTAKQMIAQYIAIGIAKIFAGMGGAGGGGDFKPVGDLAAVGNVGTGFNFDAGAMAGGMPWSFAGGGYTGSAPRAGGIDGQGGFPAILHPQETVIDHTRAMAVPYQRSAASAAPATMEVPYQRSGPTMAVPFQKSAGSQGSNNMNEPIDVKFETVRIGGVDYVTRDEAEQIGRESAQRGADLAHKRYRNSPSARRAVGMS